MSDFDGTIALTPWIENLPNDWQLSRIDHVADVFFSNVDKHTIEEEQPVRLCNYVDVYKNEKITASLGFMEATADRREIEKFQIKRHDVLSTKDSETPDDIAITALVAEDIPDVLCGYHLAMMRSRSKRLYGPFLAWVHASKQFRAHYEARAVGVTRFGLPQYAFRSARIPLPPRPEQERIAAYLDASCTAIDAAVAVKQKQIETLNLLHKAIIMHAVTKGLNNDVEQSDSGVEWFGRIPKHWHCQHLKRLTTRIQTGCTPPTDQPDYYIDGTIPWYAPGSYDDDIELSEPRKHINELAWHDGVLRVFPPEAVFIVGIGATIGKVGIIRSKASCNQQIIGIVTNAKLIGRYLAYQFKIYEEIIPKIAAATTLPIFDQLKTGYLPTLLPPRKEQEAICGFLDIKLAEVKRIIAGIESQIDILTAYRKSLIHECVTGKRRIADADLKKVKAHG